MKFDEIEILDDDKTDVEFMNQIIKTRNQEDAFYILDVKDVIKKHETWITKLPRVEPHFAVKCNPDPTVVKVLACLNAGFDCASKHEIELVRSCGVSGDRIIFAQTVKPRSHIEFAKNVGVDKFTVDNEFELHKMKKIFPDAKIILRFRCDATSSSARLGAKFGCDPENEAKKLMRLAKDLDLDLHGFSFHVGSLCKEMESYSRGITIARELIEHAESMGFPNVKSIDIGGGFPGETGSSIDEYAETINCALEKVKPSIRIVSEPGRFYVASAFTLVSLIHGKKIVDDGNEMRYTYYTNDGTYGSFIETLMNITMRIPTPLNELSKSKTYPTTFWGPTCDCFDLLVPDCRYPELNIGDWIVWRDMGAYTLSLAGTFNGLHPPVVIPFADRNAWNLLMNRPETFGKNSMSNGTSGLTK